MTAEMKQLGELFKVKREELSLSLKEVENATSIRLMYLQAIEDGHVDKLLSSVYALGFIKQYAHFLGFDRDQIVKDYPKAFALRPEAQEFAYGIGTMEMRGNSQGKVRYLPNMMWIAILSGSLVLAWFFAKSIGLF